MVKEIATELGYIWNEKTERLESYELIEAIFKIDSPMVEYHCKLGGTECVIESENLKVYRTEEDFRNSKALKPYIIDTLLFKRELGIRFEENGEPRAWICKNNHALDVNVGGYPITFHADGEKELTSSIKFYKDESEVYRFNDFQKVDSDGNVKLCRSPYSKTKLTDRQLQLAGELARILKEMENEELTLVYDTNRDELSVLNRKELASLHAYYYDEEKVGFDTADFRHRISKSNIIGLSCDEYLYAEEKEN